MEKNSENTKELNELNEHYYELFGGPPYGHMELECTGLTDKHGVKSFEGTIVITGEGITDN